MDEDSIPYARRATTTPESLGYGRPERVYRVTNEAFTTMSTRRVWTLLDSLSLIGSFMILLAILLPSSGSSRASRYAACSSNLRQIVIAATNYAEDHKGVFANSPALLRPRYLNSACFQCSGAKKGKYEIGSRGSFVYCGGRLTSASADSSLIAYEHPSNHPERREVYFAYKDGSVRSFPINQAQRIIDELQAGFNPPRPEKLQKNPVATSGVAP